MKRTDVRTARARREEALARDELKETRDRPQAPSEEEIARARAAGLLKVIPPKRRPKS